MKTITLYQSSDGKTFKDYDECYLYELKYEHPNLFHIDFYDSKDKIYNIPSGTLLLDYVYNNAEKIKIHNEQEYQDLIWFSKECGWCEFEQITGPGIWIRYRYNEYSRHFEGYWRKIK